MGYTLNEGLSFLENWVKAGRRYSLGVKIIGKGAHVLSIERNEGGALFLYDSLSGEIISDGEVAAYVGSTSGLHIWRTDNASFDVEMASEIARVCDE